MRNFISFLTIILCCLTVTPMHGRKKDKQADKEEVVLAMVEPDMMATPSHSHPVVAPPERPYPARSKENHLHRHHAPLLRKIRRTRSLHRKHPLAETHHVRQTLRLRRRRLARQPRRHESDHLLLLENDRRRDHEAR